MWTLKLFGSQLSSSSYLTLFLRSGSVALCFKANIQETSAGRTGCCIREAGNLGRWWTGVQKPNSKDTAPPWNFLEGELFGEGLESLLSSIVCRLFPGWVECATLILGLAFGFAWLQVELLHWAWSYVAALDLHLLGRSDILQLFSLIGG